MTDDNKDEPFEIITFNGPPTHVSESIPIEPSGKNFRANPHEFKQLESPQRLGRYTLTHLIGKGGMAEVFLAKQDGPAGFEKTVVVKRIRKSLLEEKKFIDMFLREARIAARLNHTNVVQIFELGEVDGEYFMAMEFLDGITLHRAARRSWAMERSMPMEVVLKCVADAAMGLQYAHTLRNADGSSSPLIHRDVSPDNLLLSRDGVTKVLDFGIAKDIGGDEDDLVTKTGEIKGKVPYMAPEQIRGETLDGRADLWSLGVTAYWLLTGRRPFDGGSDHMTIDHILRAEPTPLREINPLVPVEVSRVILSLLEKDAGSRLASGQELNNELVQILGPAAGGAATASFAEEMMAAPGVESKLPPGQIITVAAARPVTAWLQRVKATGGTHFENMLPEPTPTSSSGMKFKVTPDPHTTSKTGDLDALREEVLSSGGQRPGIAIGIGAAVVAMIGLLGAFLFFGAEPDREDLAALPDVPVAEPAPTDDSPPEPPPAAADPPQEPTPASAEPAAAEPVPVTAEEKPPDLKTPIAKPDPAKRARKKETRAVEMAVKAPAGILWLDARGKRLGKGSGTLMVPKGASSVTAYNPARGVRTVLPVGASANYSQLKRGRISFRVRPWAKVFLGKTAVGTTPMDTMAVVEGTYKVRLEQDAKKTTRTVVVKPGGHAVLKVDMNSL